MQIRQSRVLRGPNVWARVPVVHLVVDIGPLEDTSSERLPGFNDRLLAWLPTLAGHGCSLGVPGGFVERLREGTWMGHVLEHVALDLQNLAGAKVARGKTRSTNEPGVYNVVYAYEQEDVGLAAGELARRMVAHLAQGDEPALDVVAEIERLIRLAERLAYGPSTGAIVAAAERRGIPVLRLDPRRSLVQLGHARFQQRVWTTLTSRSADIASQIARDKGLTNRLLEEVGVPTPGGGTAGSADDAARLARRLGFPVVLKPADGNHGRGVALDLADEAAVRGAFAAAAGASRTGRVVVERFVAGTDHRVLVVAGRVVAVAERVPAHVVGDGASTVQALVERTNADPRRGVGHEKVLTRIPLDAATDAMLADQGMTLATVPAVGERVWLRRTGNMSTGGTSIDRTDEIHPDTAEIAAEAALAVGLDVAGIDLIAPDIGRSIAETGGAVVEVNAGPGVRMHTHPTEGRPRQVGRAVVDLLFPDDAPARIPIVAVTGTNGKTTTTRMVAAIAAAAGHRVGLTTTDGIDVGGRQIKTGDMAGPTSAQLVLKHPTVSFAALETARGGILRSGLGFDRCNVAVVTNIASDHLGLGGVETLEDLARVKAVVPQSVFRSGASVLNADNPWTVEMARSARGEIVFFSLDEENPIVREHLREQGRAVVLIDRGQGETLALLEGERQTPIALASEIPATMDGLIRANVANALAAAAAGIGCGFSLETIRTALGGFANTLEQAPGRFNLLAVEGRRVVVDYGHNIGAYEAMADVVRRSGAPRAIGSITMPGDRRDEDVRACCRLAAAMFDRVVLRDDGNQRGRGQGAMVEVFRQALLDAGMPGDRIHTVADDIAAAHACVDLADPGDIVVIFVHKFRDVIAELQRREERHRSAAPADGRVDGHAEAAFGDGRADGASAVDRHGWTVVPGAIAQPEHEGPAPHVSAATHLR